jgi:WD40 repeat protein
MEPIMSALLRVDLRKGLYVAALLASFNVLARAAEDPKPSLPRFEKGEPANPLRESPDGKLKVRADGPKVVLIDTATRKPVGTAMTHDAPPINRKEVMVVSCWAFSPDGKLLATGAGYKSRDGDNEGQVCVWDVATGRCVAQMSMRIGRVGKVAFTKDGSTVRYRAEAWAIDGP